MAFKVVRSTEFDWDLDFIHDHLVESYIDLGDTFSDAFDRAEARIDIIEADLEALAQSPHQGTLSPEIAPGLRHVTKNRAIFYFQVDSEQQIILVLAVFFGGQDHVRHIQKRLNRTT
jgi:plasmid stabilization system protein ParE